MCPSFQPRSISENSVEWSTNKGGEVKTPAVSATIPHRNPYNLFNYFQYLHWCTQNTLKKEIFFFFLVSQRILNPLVHSEPSEEKGNRCILIKKECSLGASVSVPPWFISLLLIRCIPGHVTDGCGWHGGTAYASSTFTFQSTPNDTFWLIKIKSKMLFSFPFQINWFLLINRQTWDKKQKEV